MKTWTILFLLAVSCVHGAEQQLTQTITGIIYDATTKQPLPGANIIIIDSSPTRGAASDSLGRFRIENVPIGRVSLRVMFIGYRTALVENLLVHTGKQAHVAIELETEPLEMGEISVTASTKFEPLNEMSTASARMFTVEETDKYAGSRGDVARMASNYAGIAFTNDSRNDIVIRGNSPAGLLWRLDGVDIPNPNHFALEGTTGGPVGMLNNNTLSNSDFLTGAFPATYGNALSGVFDLNMRSGNSDEYEFLGQVGFNGFELGIEGPLAKNQGSSFLANYRYSTLDVMSKLGMKFGTTGIPKYQDFSGKIVYPLKHGRISGFALWGTSQIAILDSETGETDFYSNAGQDLYNNGTVAATALEYVHFHNENTSSSASISATLHESGTDIFRLERDMQQLELDDNYKEFKASLNYTLTHRFSKKFLSESGFRLNQMGFELDGRKYDFEKEAFFQYFDNARSLTDGPMYSEFFTSWRFRPGPRLTFTAGLFASHFSLNSKATLEPRIGFSYHLSKAQKLSFAFGAHSRLQWLSTYYFAHARIGERIKETNLDLDFSKAHHWVLGYQMRLTPHTRLLIEGYYQQLYSIPVRSSASSYSILNSGADFGLDLHENLVNNGTGKNYGVELTLERFYHHGFYGLSTLSLFRSLYKGSDGVERSTRFDNRFVSNILLGKEFSLSNRSTLFFDAKIAWAGGQHYTPVDLEASRLANSLKRDDAEAFVARYPNYLKMDLKIGYRLSSGRTTQEWMFYVENISNQKNIFTQKYDAVSQEIVNVYQLGIFPMMQYRIYF